MTYEDIDNLARQLMAKWQAANLAHNEAEKRKGAPMVGYLWGGDGLIELYTDRDAHVHGNHFGTKFYHVNEDILQPHEKRSSPQSSPLTAQAPAPEPTPQDHPETAV
jgi:hypothetical protein